MQSKQGAKIIFEVLCVFAFFAPFCDYRSSSEGVNAFVKLRRTR